MRDAESAAAMASRADGVVVGSALVEAVRKAVAEGESPAAGVAQLVEKLAEGVRSVAKR